jgi:dihydroorotase-like cyclic amidohydrolase
MSTCLPPFGETITKEIEAWNKSAVVDGVLHHQTTVTKQIAGVPELPDLGVVTIGEIGGYKGPAADDVGVGYMDDGMMCEIMEMVAEWGPPGRVWFHCENIDIITFLKEKIIKEDRKDSAAWTASRPAWTEAEKMKCYIEIAKGTKCPIGIVHIAIGDGPGIIASAKAEGVDVVGETCPQYLTFTKDTFKDWPPFANMNPPLREKEDNEKLWEGIQKGWIETVGSDHGPWTKDQKGDNIMTARPGVGDVLSTWMPVMLSEGVNKGRITLEKMVEVCCYNPAKYLGILPQKGLISVGSDADIVIVDLNKKQVPNAKELHSASGYNVYEFLDWELKGWPILTMVRGNVVMEDGKVIGKKGSGVYIKRKLLER